MPDDLARRFNKTRGSGRGGEGGGGDINKGSRTEGKPSGTKAKAASMAPQQFTSERRAETN